MERTRLVLGAMTRTSIDGIDLALVRIGGEGLAMRVEPVAFRSSTLGDLAPRLRAAADQQPMSAAEFAELARDLGLLHAREARELLRAAESTASTSPRCTARPSSTGRRAAGSSSTRTPSRRSSAATSSSTSVATTSPSGGREPRSRRSRTGSSSGRRTPARS